MASTKRDHLIETALQLFYKNGFHATGIDTILHHAGVARMTLYNHFKSKNELILAVIRRQDELFLHWLRRYVARHAKHPNDHLLKLYDALGKWFTGKGFSGCLFINACAEFSDVNDPVHVAACEHKTRILGFIQELAAQTNIQDPDLIAHEIMLLVEGAIVMFHVTGDKNAAINAKKAAEKLIIHASTNR